MATVILLFMKTPPPREQFHIELIVLIIQQQTEF